MTNAVLTAARARLTTAFPAWHDATGASHPTPAAKLPAFALRVTYSDGERVAMGDPRMMREGQIEIGLEVSATEEADLHDLAGQIAQAILAPPEDLGGTVWQILYGGFETDHDTGETPVSRGDLILPIQVLE